MQFSRETRAKQLAPLKWIVATGVITLLCACDPQNIYNTESQQQNTAQAEAKEQSLQPAVGYYCGNVHLTDSDEDFDANLSLQIIEDNEHSSSSTDPTDTVQVPKLAGSLTFPAIKNQGSAAYSTLPELMQATGGTEAISFTYGDYNPGTQIINLPFNVPNGPQGDYGSLSGTLNGNQFSGTWYSESSQAVGTFTLTKCGGQS
jgi:hypothetical protein